jgi:plastocyanin
VTADNNSFDSGKRKDGEFRLRFDEPGSYSYHCTIHPDMRGKVVVH